MKTKGKTHETKGTFLDFRDVLDITFGNRSLDDEVKTLESLEECEISDSMEVSEIRDSTTKIDPILLRIIEIIVNNRYPIRQGLIPQPLISNCFSSTYNTLKSVARFV